VPKKLDLHRTPLVESVAILTSLLEILKFSSGAMIRENQQLVTDELVEFEE
jgi:hypothetical protein